MVDKKDEGSNSRRASWLFIGIFSPSPGSQGCIHYHVFEKKHEPASRTRGGFLTYNNPRMDINDFVLNNWESMTIPDMAIAMSCPEIALHANSNL